MRTLFVYSTLLFWCAVAAFGAAALRAPATSPAEVAAVERHWSVEEVARHDRAEDCWMIIDAQVYDLGDYLPEHPSDPAILIPWCGREATEAYRSKTRGRPHSAYADRLLDDFRIGSLK